MGLKGYACRLAVWITISGLKPVVTSRWSLRLHAEVP